MNIKKITAAASAAILSLSISAGGFVYAFDSSAAKVAPDNVKKEFNLEDYAKKLGIDTTNMTEDQIKSAIKEERVKKAKEFLVEKGLYKEGMSEKEIFKKVREYYKDNPK